MTSKERRILAGLAAGSAALGLVASSFVPAFAKGGVPAPVPPPVAGGGGGGGGGGAVGVAKVRLPLTLDATHTSVDPSGNTLTSTDPSIVGNATVASADLRWDGKTAKLTITGVDPKAYPAGCSAIFTSDVAGLNGVGALAAAVAPGVGNTASVALKGAGDPTGSHNSISLTCGSAPTGKLKTVTWSHTYWSI
jgi:hypothetical protein